LKIASSAAPAVSARRHTRYDPFAHRELQGGVTGDMHLENAGVHVVLRAGRVSGISVDPLGPIDLRGRGSGFVQSASGGAGVPALTTYLETHTSAWFTSDSERGVHETAELAGVFHIETTVFAPEDHGGVVLNVRVQRIGPPPNGLIRISPIEVALAVSVPGSESSRTRVFVRDSDEAIESDDLADGGAELSGTAVGLGRDGPAMWLIPIDPDGIPIAPFSFSGGRTAGRHGEPAILWRPLGYAETPDDPIFSCREWTASYRILAGDRPPEISSTPEEIARSIDGFTALGLADRP
jgi:hypothetical protein